jgi:mono/diheme cytochrome c family protein/Na+-transporting methylmalonyl-CoA/oxaloacetate decarboxylase gamma subunit
MKKVKYRHSASRIVLLSASLFLSFNTLVFAQDSPLAEDQDRQETVQGPEESNVEAEVSSGDVAAGKEIFNTLCAACHKLDGNSIGPPLRGVGDRRDTEWLHEWIRNSQALIAAGDEQAVEIFNEYNQVAMPPFPQLSDTDIDNILAYVNQPKAVPQAQEVTTTGAGAAQGGGGVSTDILLGILAFVLLMLLVILYLVNKTLRRFAVASGVELPVKEKRGKPIWKAFVENQFLVIVTAVILVLVGSYFAYGWMMQVGVDQGYQPIQPIHFSHRIHAGENQIECKFCHSSARVSKTSGIPSLNVCMNCHKSISEVAEATATEEYSKEFYDGEIAKLYDAVGWDVAQQAYTGETEPVKWIRIHNLPDFAYFNHAQHVEVGGIACQTCHGPVEEMEIMYQNAPLTMGWCVNCHRETNVRTAGNEYYEKVHEELSKKYEVEELTVAQMGGIECAKCHY